jgi:G6PDH family F420-dependent oxidoreductase
MVAACASDAHAIGPETSHSTSQRIDEPTHIDAGCGYRAIMTKIGYFLSCEQFGPKELIEQAKRAEAAGFEALWISDHFHPWNDAQGQSPFVWAVIGALSEATSLPVSTAVTCPTTRIHPAIIAQVAATAAAQLGGRFVLGVGSGEALNEHILGDTTAALR